MFPKNKNKSLEIKNLSKHIGGLPLADNINLTFHAGQRHAIIGPNGAGKTSLFHLITGELQSDSGKIIYNNKDITKLAAYKRSRLGLSRSFQRNNLFMGYRLKDNLRFAAIAALGLGGCFWRRGSASIEARVLEIAESLDLLDVLESHLSVLSYGSLRQLEIGMALLSRPSLLLLDEPMAGMSAIERQKMLSLLDNLPKDLIYIMIEHDMDIVFDFADIITVMHQGAIVMSGSPEQVRNSPEVRSLYLGKL